jgi:hypothetical protein
MPGMSVRFAVRDNEGRRSAMWSLFSMGSNVGLTTTEVGGLMKANLHESGSWQIGYTSEYERKQRTAGKWQGGSRHWQIWGRPEAVQPGYTAAVKILVPSAALARRAEPTKTKPVRWIDSREGYGVSFTVWLCKSKVPPWGYGGNNECIATLPLPNGEVVLVGAHYVSGRDATEVMLRGLGGFVKTLMEQDTASMDPLPTNATLIGFSDEPSGVRTITEIALWSLTTADPAPSSAAPPGTVSHQMADDLSRGLMDIAIAIPPSVFRDAGVDPATDPDGAKELAAKWNATKVADMRRILRLPVAA